MRQTPKVLAASIVVYLAVAACSAAGESITKRLPDAGPLPTEGDGALDAIVDAVTRLDKEAAASPLQVDEEPCDKTFGVYSYAERSYPGRTVAELARVSAIVQFPDGYAVAPPGYRSQLGQAFIRDGAAAVLCGATSSGADQVRVTFVLPP